MLFNYFYIIDDTPVPSRVGYLSIFINILKFKIYKDFYLDDTMNLGLITVVWSGTLL
uniref:Uncharacterized protein n=1 Tax=Ciona intestinalis TaxID=7719 RepID=H2XYC3_CIOIN